MGSTVERLLVRTWNLFRGNTKPAGRRTFLEEMIRLAVEDAPAILCLQELPVWGLTHLAAWSGMSALTDVAKRPLPHTAELGHRLSDIDARLFRTAFTGQADALLLARELEVLEHRHLVLNPFRFRRGQGRRLDLPLRERFDWARERRVCQAARVRRADATLVVANLHATSHHTDKRIADAELLRAAVFVDGFARPGEPVLLCGDFNLSLRNSHTLAELMSAEWGFEGATPTGIDHILVRGLTAKPARIWPLERRTRDGHVLSDHAPVDREVE
jgi:endonuclease/exonuclease/phosphatase family metal-dependent hydrolase